LRGVVPLWWVIVVGEGRVPEMLPLVVVVAVETFRMVVVVVVMVKMMIRIQTRFLGLILDPGRLLKATSNREHNLLLSRLLLPY